MTIQKTRFSATDGHRFSACISEPEQPSRGLVILIQEIFGLTDYLCSLTGTFAEQGYTSIAPALFDRVQTDIRLDYDDADAGRQLVAQLDPEQVLLDLQALIDTHGINQKVAVIGYCWGGSIAYLAANRLKLDAAIAYYGTRIHEMLDLKPQCPMQFHFGAEDHLVPKSAVEDIRAALPDSPLYVYPHAGHAFSCEPRPSYQAASAELALERTLLFLQKKL